jgi:K+-transporting ATPase c subunit
MAVAPSSGWDAPKSARRRRRRDHLCSITAANHVARKQIARRRSSGLDPDLTLQNARYQLDRVAAKWAQDTKRDELELRKRFGSPAD